MPAARAFCASRATPPRRPWPLTIIRSANSSTTMTMYGSFSGGGIASGRLVAVGSTHDLVAVRGPTRVTLPARLGASCLGAISPRARFSTRSLYVVMFSCPRRRTAGSAAPSRRPPSAARCDACFMSVTTGRSMCGIPSKTASSTTLGSIISRRSSSGVRLREERGEHHVEPDALARAGRARDEQVRHLREVAVDGLARDVLAERARQRRLASVAALVLEELAQVHRLRAPRSAARSRRAPCRGSARRCGPSARRAPIARSSARPAIFETFVPLAGSNSYIVTTGPGWISSTRPLHAVACELLDEAGGVLAKRVRVDAKVRRGRLVEERRRRQHEGLRGRRTRRLVRERVERGIVRAPVLGGGRDDARAGRLLRLLLRARGRERGGGLGEPGHGALRRARPLFLECLLVVELDGLVRGQVERGPDAVTLAVLRARIVFEVAAHDPRRRRELLGLSLGGLERPRLAPRLDQRRDRVAHAPRGAARERRALARELDDRQRRPEHHRHEQDRDADDVRAREAEERPEHLAEDLAEHPAREMPAVDGAAREGEVQHRAADQDDDERRGERREPEKGPRAPEEPHRREAELDRNHPARDPERVREDARERRAHRPDPVLAAPRVVGEEREHQQHGRRPAEDPQYLVPPPVEGLDLPGDVVLGAPKYAPSHMEHRGGRADWSKNGRSGAGETPYIP